jgi:hypothetical protein
MVISLLFTVFLTPISVVSAAPIQPNPSWEPQIFETGDIPYGGSVQIQYTLQAGKTYHIFLVGNWTEIEPVYTDYDMYVSGPGGVSYRFTEAKGMPEQVSNDRYGNLFTPEESGVYTFEIRNDSSDPTCLDGAVFMLIEHVETDQVYDAILKGRLTKNGPYPSESIMTYVCEFTTDSSNFVVHVGTPDDLDLYEVRLFKMATLGSHGHDIFAFPTPLGSDFFGNTTGDYGGYNYAVDGVRSPIFASCYDYGVDIDIAPTEGDFASESMTTYFLVFIAEYSKYDSPSTVPFFIRVDGTAPEPTLSEPIEQAIAGYPLCVKADVSTTRRLSRVWLNYALNGVTSDEEIPMTLVGDQYVGYMPEFSVNDIIEYSISAMDEIGNCGVYSSSYSVMAETFTTCSLSSSYVSGGDDVVVSGLTTRGESIVSLKFTCDSYSESVSVTSDQSGGYTYLYTPKRPGTWAVVASYAGEDEYSPSTSTSSTFVMEPQFTSISCSVLTPSVKIGNDVEIIGSTTPSKAGIPVEILLVSGSESKILTTSTGSDGAFRVSEKLGEGQWDVLAQVKGNWRFSSSSSELSSASVIPLTSMELMMLQLIAFTNPPYVYAIVAASGVILVLLLRWKGSVIAPKLPAPVRNFITRFSSPAPKKKPQSSGLRESYKRRSGEPES